MEITLGELAEKIGGKLKGESRKIIKRAASFENAGRDDITFLTDKKLLKDNIHIKDMGAVILSSDIFDTASFDNAVISANPKFAFAKAVSILHPPAMPTSGISPRANIEEGSLIGDEVYIGDFVFIGRDVSIGDRVIIYPNVFIGENVRIGDDTVIYPNVSIYDGTVIGKRTIIHAGSVIGSDGFGYVYANGKHNKVPHIGTVRIDDEVEIGASNTIDRGVLDKTWIRKGVKTDNHVHIAHNVEVGENTLIIAQAGIAGSTKIGKNVIIAGQSGINGHIEIKDRAVVGPRTAVSKSVGEGETVSGAVIQMPHKIWRRVQSIIPKLPEIKRKIDAIEKKLKD